MTRCPLCRKGSQMVTRRVLLRGNYNPTTKRRKYPNLQWMLIPDHGREALIKKLHLAQNARRAKVCTDCKKTVYKSTA